MPLRGTVPNYGLADVLQLIARGSRSGRLRIERASEAVDVVIEGGVILEARTGVPPDGVLGSRLVQAGLLTDEALGWALAARVESGRSLGELLVESGHLDAETFRLQATLQRWDNLLAPFTWEDGRYAFEETAPTFTEDGGEPVSVDLLLMKGLRLIDEWPNALARVPSRKWVVARRVPLPTEPLTDDLLTDRLGEAGPVGPEARVVHGLAAPGVRVGRIVGRAPFDAFETTLALAELSGLGFLVLSPP